MSLCFGWDATSEHEWGIDTLRWRYDAYHPQKVGIDRHRIGKTPGSHILLERSEFVYLGATDFKYHEDPEKWSVPRCCRIRKGENFAAAWDRSEFGCAVNDDEGKAYLREFQEAIMNGDAAIYLGGASILGNAGLVLSIVSRIPQESLDAMAGAHQERARLDACVERVEETTGLQGLLKEAGRKWYALSPRFLHPDDLRRKKTAFEVHFWLNPEQQHIYEAGWYTVEELLLWAQGKGPVIDDHKNRY